MPFTFGRLTGPNFLQRLARRSLGRLYWNANAPKRKMEKALRESQQPRRLTCVWSEDAIVQAAREIALEMGYPIAADPAPVTSLPLEVEPRPISGNRPTRTYDNHRPAATKRNGGVRGSSASRWKR